MNYVTTSFGNWIDGLVKQNPSEKNLSKAIKLRHPRVSQRERDNLQHTIEEIIKKENKAKKLKSVEIQDGLIITDKLLVLTNMGGTSLYIPLSKGQQKFLKECFNLPKRN